MINCRDCNKPVSKYAETCPHCGCSSPGLSETLEMGSWIVLLMVVGGSIAFFIWVVERLF